MDRTGDRRTAARIYNPLLQQSAPSGKSAISLKKLQKLQLSPFAYLPLSLCKLQQTAVWPLFFFNSSHLFPFDPLGGDSNGKGTFLTLALVTRYGWDLSF